MVLDADTVVDPLAVMVKSLDALVADVAVTRISRADHFASWAQHVGVKLLNESQEGDLSSVFHVTGVLLHGKGEEDQGGREEDEKQRHPTISVDVYKKRMS